MIWYLLLALILVPASAHAVDSSVLTRLEATTALDNFNNTNNPISGSTPSGGGTWTDKVNPTADGNLQTNGSAVQAVTVGLDGTAYHSRTWGPNLAAMITITTKNGSDEGLIGIFFGLANIGASTTDGYRGEIRIRATTDEFRIQRYDNETPTVISSGTLQEVSAGDKFAVVRSGSVIELWWKTGSTWTQVVTVSDSTYTGSGLVGIQVSEVSTITGAFDNFTVMNLGGQKCIGCGIDQKVIGN